MPKSKAELMAALRLKRHKAGLEQITVWIKSVDREKVLKLLKKYRQDAPKDE